MSVAPLRARVAAALAASVILTAHSTGQPCAPAWRSGLNVHGLSGQPTALFQSIAYSGTDLFIGGQFNAAGSGVNAKGVARWDGHRWNSLAPGLAFTATNNSAQNVRRFVVYDDGSGPALYICGQFDLVGNLPTPSIAKWNGHSLEPLPDPFARNISPISAYGLAVFDDGSGSSLYFGASFRRVHGVNTGGVAKWDGASWSPVGAGFGFPHDPDPFAEDGVSGLEVFDDGSGPRLYALAHGLGPLKLARLETGEWVEVPGAPPLTTGSFPHYRLAAINSGPARGLYTWGAGVAFSRFDGASWTPMPPGASSARPLLVQAIATTPPMLGVARAGPSSQTIVEYWDGAQWASAGPNLPTSEQCVGFALEPGSDGLAPTPVVQRNDPFGPYVTLSAGVSLTESGIGSAEPIRQICRFPSAPGSPEYALRAGPYGRFDDVATLVPEGWARLAPIGAFVDANDGYSLTTLDTPVGERLVLVGDPTFRTSPTATAPFALGLFDGTEWSPLGRLSTSAGSQSGWAATTFDSGAGSDMYVAGAFASLDGVPVSFIARRTPAGWDTLAGGLNGPGHLLAVHDDGSGPALYVGGDFSRAGNIPALRLARWNGAAWSSLPGFTAGYIRTFLVARESGHQVLYVAGEAMYANGRYLGRLAKYDRGVWSATPISAIASPGPLALAAYGDGPTQFVLAAGSLPMTLGVFPLGRMAIYDGVRWSGIAADIDGQVTQILVDESPAGGVTITLGGDFTRVNDIASTNFARIDLCSLACPADTNADRVINMADLNNMLDQYGVASPAPGFILPADLNADGVVNFLDLNILLSAFGQTC